MTKLLFRRLGAIGLALTLTTPALAQTFADNTAYGGTSGEFLLLGAGARGTALGGAYAALATDVTALYYNPGGLAQLARPGAMVSTYDYVAGTRYSWLGAAFPLTGGARAPPLGTPDVPQEPQPSRLRASGWDLPVLFRVSAALDLYNRGQNRVTVLGEFTQPNDTKPAAGGGLEVSSANIGNSGFS